MIQYVRRHTGLGSALSLTEATVAANPSSGGQLTGTGAGVGCDGLADDEAIRDKLADRLTRVGVGDLIDFVGVKPDLALATTDDGRRKTLLGAEVDPVSGMN